MANGPVLDGQDARQGKTGLNVRVVLITGVILVVLAFAIIAWVMH